MSSPGLAALVLVVALADPVGALQIVNSVLDATGGTATFPPRFQMTADCGAGPARSVTVAPGPAGARLADIPAGARCIVSEKALQPVERAADCPPTGTAAWTTVVSPASALITVGAVTTVNVGNTLACTRP